MIKKRSNDEVVDYIRDIGNNIYRNAETIAKRAFEHPIYLSIMVSINRDNGISINYNINDIDDDDPPNGNEQN